MFVIVKKIIRKYILNKINSFFLKKKIESLKFQQLVV